MYKRDQRAYTGRKAILTHTNKLFCLSLIVLTLLLLFSIPCSCKELITNGGFESGLSGWEKSNLDYPSLITTSEFAHSGSTSLRLVHYYNNYIVRGFYQTVNVTATSTANLTFYYNSSGAELRAFLYRGDSWDNNIWQSAALGSTSNNWVKYTGNLGTLTAGKYRLFVYEYYQYDALIDDISIIDNNLDPAGNISSSAGIFEYGKTGWYSVTMTDAGQLPYSVDVYGKLKDNYTYLGTYNFTNTLSGDNIIEITAPLETTGYKYLYAVLRDQLNNTFSNTTDLIVTDKTDYFEFVPDEIGYGEISNLVYSVNFTENPNYLGNRRYFIQDAYFSSGNNVPWIHVYQDLNLLDSGSIPFGAYDFGRWIFQNNTSVKVNDVNAKLGVSLYCTYREWFDKYDTTVALKTAELRINGDNNESGIPHYEHVADPNESAYENRSQNESGTPDPYKPPSYPAPDNPNTPKHHDSDNNEYDNPDYNPGYDNSTHYDPDSHSWEYNNTSAYNGTDGYYPVDIKGNTSVDTSRFQGFYDYVDEAYSPVNNSVYGFLNFLLSPITQLTQFIITVKENFIKSVAGLIDIGLIQETFVPVFAALPHEIKAIILFSLSLSIIAVLLRRG